MSGLKNKIFEKLNPFHVWIFITDKCNLKCDYCFFSDRRGTKNLGFKRFSSLLSILPNNKKYDFVISGGEPLLCWSFAKKMVERIKGLYKDSDITLQTNMFYLTKDIAKVLKKYDVVIEPGLDGRFLSNFRHRKGFTEENYKKCIKNLSIITENKLDMNPTMTVHPDEARFMFENFKKLVSLGLNSIDVHPAFMADWKKHSAKEFMSQYKKIIEYERESGRYLVCKSYSSPLSLSFDLVVQPDGFVLPNWTFLIFPRSLRENFFLMKLLPSNKVIIFKDTLLEYLKNIERFFQKQRSYREFSNFNASLILKYADSQALKRKFSVYESLSMEIQYIDRLFLKKKDTIQ